MKAFRGDGCYSESVAGFIADELLTVLVDLIEEDNFFYTTETSCECGQHGDGWSEGDGQGTPCVHIRAARAIKLAREGKR